MAAVAAELRSPNARLAEACNNSSSSTSSSKPPSRVSSATSTPTRYPGVLLRNTHAALLAPFLNPSFGGLSFCFRSVGADRLRGLPPRAFQTLDSDFPADGEEEWEEWDDGEVGADEADSEDYPSDVESLEEEARNVAGEYALSVSRGLSRGNFLKMEYTNL